MGTMGTSISAAMPRKYTLHPVKTTSTDRKRQWKVDVPASVSQSGKRQRFFFQTKALADGFSETERSRLTNFGLQGGNPLTPSEAEQSTNALMLLQPYRVSLNEVVADWINRKKSAEASVTFEAGMDEFLKWRVRSSSYKRSIEQTKNRLVGLHGKLLNQITPADLTRAMDGMTPSVHNFTIRILGGLFNFGIKRNLCASNPTKKLDLAQQTRKEIEIYTPQQSAKILRAAEQKDQELVPFLALSFFTGIRLSEMQRLDWSAVDLDEKFVRLPASITKTKQTRHIDILANLAAWLSPYAKKSGAVVAFSPDVLRNRMETLRSHHKIPTIKHGPRHCFASYWLAQHGDINQLCRFLGHDDPGTTFRHYAKAATKRESGKFFAIMPKKGKQPTKKTLPKNSKLAGPEAR